VGCEAICTPIACPLRLVLRRSFSRHRICHDTSIGMQTRRNICEGASIVSALQKSEERLCCICRRYYPAFSFPSVLSCVTSSRLVSVISVRGGWCMRLCRPSTPIGACCCGDVEEGVGGLVLIVSCYLCAARDGHCLTQKIRRT
jgi:hypothetical protein